MTRTARAHYPRALRRDRSSSKSGLDKSVQKHGAGLHNWGSLEDEVDNEFYAALEAEEELETVSEDERSSGLSSSPEMTFDAFIHGNAISAPAPRIRRSNSNTNEDERVKARSFRTRSFNGNRNDIDLGTIARTSVAVSAPAKDMLPGAPADGQAPPAPIKFKA